MFQRRDALMTLYAGVVLAGSGLIVNAGDLNPPAGPVAPTMVTLDEIDLKLDQVLAGLGARSSDAARGAGSADEIFMLARGIQGESNDLTHQDWIELTSATVSVDGPNLDPSGIGISPPRMLDAVVVTGRVDRALTQLMTDQTQSRRLIDLEIEWCREALLGPAVFLRVEMSECFVTSTRIELNGSFADPVFTVSLEPVDDVTLTYTQLDENGNALGTFSQSFNVQTGVTR